MMAALLCACSKHNNSGNPYYFTFQSGNINYSSPMVDSLLYCTDTVFGTLGQISLSSYRTQAQTDSAAAGEATLVTWSINLLNYSSPTSAFSGTYISDTSAGSNRLVSIWNGDFRFYTSYDPHHGVHYVVPQLPFTVTITQVTSTYVEGTFEGQLLQTNGTTNVSDTATITNGKFKLPLRH